MTREEAAGFAALCSINLKVMLQVLRKEMGNVIVDPSCDEGLQSLFDSCRKNDSLKEFRRVEFR